MHSGTSQWGRFFNPETHKKIPLEKTLQHKHWLEEKLLAMPDQNICLPVFQKLHALCDGDVAALVAKTEAACD